MLSAKKSRPISFQDEDYRWAVSLDGAYLTLVVQHNDSNGQKLEIIMEAIEQDTENPNENNDFRPIKPSFVTQLMAMSFQIGWQPVAISAPPLELTLDKFENLTTRRGLISN